MKKQRIETAIAAANPVRRAKLGELELGAAEREMLAAILDEPWSEERRQNAGAAPVGRSFAWLRFPKRSLTAATAVTAAAALFIAIGIGGGPATGPAPAIGGGLARLIEASPPILLQAPGWRLERADESFMSEGSNQFALGGEDSEDPTRFAELQWSSTESLSSRVRGLESLPRKLEELAAKEGAQVAPYLLNEVEGAPVLGTTARVFVHPEIGTPYSEVQAVWEEEGELRVFRTFVPDLETFRHRLGALSRVDAETWLDALKGRVIERRNGVVVLPRDVP